MEIGELFVKLGIDGDGKFTNGIKKADQALKGIVSSSFLAKTGIGLLALGFLKASQVAGQMGMGFSILQTRTGIAAETFQKFAYAGELAGVKAEETQGAIAALQKQMDDFAVTGEGPQWINEIAKNTGLNLDRAIQDTTYLFAKLQQYATNPAINKMQKRLVLGSFGLSDNMVAAMMNGAFNAKAMQQAQVVTQKQVATLAKVNAEWAKLKWNIKASNAQMVALVGESTIDKIATISSKFYDASFAILHMLENSEAVKKAFDSWMWIIEGVLDNIKKAAKLFEVIDEIKPEHVWGGIKEAGKDVVDFFAAQFDAADGLLGKIFGGKKENDDTAIATPDTPADGLLGKIFSGKKEDGDTAIATPAVLQSPAAPVMSKSSIMSSADDHRKVTINQTNNFTNADDNPQQIAQATSGAINDSFQSQTTAAMRGLIGTAGGI